MAARSATRGAMRHTTRDGRENHQPEPSLKNPSLVVSLVAPCVAERVAICLTSCSQVLKTVE